jgi:hypothetical protein
MRDSQSRGVTGAVVFDVSQGQAPLPSPGSALPLWRTNDEHRYNPPMGVSRCRVSFTDSEGISHAVEVQAESLYQAVALAVSEFRNDSVTSMPGPMTEFMIPSSAPLPSTGFVWARYPNGRRKAARRKDRPESPGGRRY